jgi:signal transducing adaptor molecule
LAFTLLRHNEKVKATDETLTGENWEIILNLCDKVQDEGEQGSVSRHLYSPIMLTFASARNVIAAVLKRLAHRNPNVQLYSLTLTESLSKNCGKDLHSEIASRAFTQALERLITDRVRTLTTSPLL